MVTEVCSFPLVPLEERPMKKTTLLDFMDCEPARVLIDTLLNRVVELQGQLREQESIWSKMKEVESRLAAANQRERSYETNRDEQKREAYKIAQSLLTPDPMKDKGEGVWELLPDDHPDAGKSTSPLEAFRLGAEAMRTVILQALQPSMPPVKVGTREDN